MTVRSVQQVVAAVYALEGAGFGVYRPFPTGQLDLLDPFLLLDEMEPEDLEPGEAKGAPAHPHRGFETVTYVLEGEVEHRDSTGGHGVIGPGGIQWMTAGDGVVHSEMPSHRVQTEGGRVHGFQVWVNLPRAEKRTPPRYQGFDADDLATSSGDAWSARIVAGRLFGVDGPASTHTPIGYAHLTVEPGHRVEISVPDDHNAGMYAFGGEGVAGADDTLLPNRHLAVFHRAPGAVAVAVPADADGPLDALVLTGRPLDEPVARYGPFVMNTQHELVEAIDDFNVGRMGSIAPAGTP